MRLIRDRGEIKRIEQIEQGLDVRRNVRIGIQRHGLLVGGQGQELGPEKAGRFIRRIRHVPDLIDRHVGVVLLIVRPQRLGGQQADVRSRIMLQQRGDGGERLIHIGFGEAGVHKPL
ncbi:MAG: hypothetical protein COV75_02190 [Candidatus Omnitrophica bacterium CG11_big_fil_rev_8_21_14_0_20_63_9]|nr:MAG: hypothetical protein COV75_02190 [Candidatus Omnitrophica bacterium CG11_big_fil_rev_8_21_14_0_20_63_9]